MFIKNKLIYYIEAIWLLSLITLACLVYLNQELIWLFFSSDHLMFPTLFKDLFLNHGHYKDWSLSPAPHFFPDTIIFLPAFLLTKKIYFQFLITSCLQLLLIYFSIKYIYSHFFSKKQAILFSLVATSIFYFSIFKNTSPYIYALLPAVHIGEFIIGIFFIGLQLTIIDNVGNLDKRGYLFYFSLFLSFLASLSDLLFVTQFSAAVFLTYLIFYVKSTIRFSLLIYYALIPFLGSILGACLTKHLVPINILSNYLPHLSFSRISSDVFHNQLLLFIDMFRRNVDWWRGGQFAIFYSGVFIISIYFFFKKTEKYSDSLSIKLFFLSNFIFFSIFCSLAPIFLLAHEAIVRDWYIFPIFFFPILTFFYLITLFDRFVFVQNILLLFAIIITFISIVLWFNKYEFKIKKNYYPSYVSCIDHALHSYGHNGVANYWEANTITMLSREGLVIVPALFNLVKFPFAMNIKKYKASYGFAIVNTSPPEPTWSLDQSVIETLNGKPEKIIICENRKLLIYPLNNLKII